MLRTMLFSVFMLVSFSANAVLITGNTIKPNGVDYTSFSIDADSSVTMETLNGLFDPELMLFRDDGVLDVTDYIDGDDDSGTDALEHQNSLLTVVLSAGDYIIAVGDYGYEIAEAVSGAADIGYDGDVTYNLSITATNATVTVTTVGTSVPEPSAIALMGLGLLGFGVTRRNKE